MLTQCDFAMQNHRGDVGIAPYGHAAKQQFSVQGTLPDMVHKCRYLGKLVAQLTATYRFEALLLATHTGARAGAEPLFVDDDVDDDDDVDIDIDVDIALILILR